MAMKIRFCNKLVTFLILGVRPLFGSAQCRYAVTCTQYAVYVLQEKPLFLALWLITKRLLSCSPLGNFFVIFLLIYT